MTRKNGFTLTELLVVIAIITLLAAVLMPALMKAWNRGAYASWTQQKNAIKGDVNCAAYFTFEEGPGTPAGSNTLTANLAYAYNPDPGGGFIPDPPEDATLNNAAGNWNRDNSRFRGLKYGLLFDGADDYVNCGNNARFDVNLPITIEAWIYPTSMPNLARIVAKCIPGPPVVNGYILSTAANNNISIGHSSYNGNAWASPNNSVMPNRWYHIVGVVTTTSARLYINGIDQGVLVSVGGITWPSNDRLGIGAMTNPSFYFPGTIDEVAIYNIALSSEEISRHYQSGNR